MDAELERSLDLFGTRVRILVGAARTGEHRSPELAALEVEATLQRVHRELSRFDPASGLRALNADPAERVRVTPLVGELVRAARDAERSSGGLVNASVIEPLVRNGYASSRVGVAPASLEEALSQAPGRRPAGPGGRSPWAQVRVSRDCREVTRPPGFQIDSGGIGKGLAADLAADRLSRFSSFAVDCGGDIRIGGVGRLRRRVEIEHPFDPDNRLGIEVSDGGVATSGLRTRIWAHRDGYSHHLIDPATGSPAWTGVIQATALAPTALEAETIAKTAVLSGPEGARSALAPGGGVLVLDSGEVEVVGELELAPEPLPIGAR